MMTREDRLRELELLPVWHLRQAMPHAPMPSVTTPQQVLIEAEHVTDTHSADIAPFDQLNSPILPVDNEQPKPLASAPQLFRYATSENADWLFVLSNDSGGDLIEGQSKDSAADEAILLNNILMAMRIKVSHATSPESIATILQLIKPKLIIAFGTAISQHLTQSTCELTQLRGVVHTHQEIPFIATYDLPHLLNNPQDKSNAWSDFCFAMKTVENNAIIKQSDA